MPRTLVSQSSQVPAQRKRPWSRWPCQSAWPKCVRDGCDVIREANGRRADASVVPVPPGGAGCGHGGEKKGNHEKGHTRPIANVMPARFEM